jgi:hypothetical protein
LILERRSAGESYQGPERSSLLIFLTNADSFRIAWALEGGSEEIEIVSSWPGGGNRK